jgi:hypothetical protein
MDFSVPEYPTRPPIELCPSDTSHHLRQMALRSRLTAQQVLCQYRVRELEQLGERLALLWRRVWQRHEGKALEKEVELLHSPAAMPAEPS